jgi:hypothetical protein
MPKLLFSGFILIASTGARVSSRVLTRSGSGKPPPATTGREMRRVSYTEFMLGAPVGRADVGCAGRAMCLDQGRSVGGSAPADAYTEALPPKCVWVDEELRTRPLTGHALRLQRLTNRQRQPELGSSRSELRDPQRFLPRPRCLLWVNGGCRSRVDRKPGLPSATEVLCAPRLLRLVPQPDLRCRQD